MPPRKISEPWGAFLSSLDGSLHEDVELVCMGGFVVALQYGFQRPTADIDVLEVRSASRTTDLMTLAGRGSPLHKKHKIYLDKVTVAALPEGYEDRLTEMFPGVFRYLRLLALDPYDLALSKLERNAERDREDVYYLAETVPLVLGVLKRRYEDEMRPYLGNGIQERTDLTLRLWIDAVEERRGN